MSNKTLLILTIITLMAAIGCRKDPSNATISGTTVNNTCVAGVGGNVTVATFPKHHGKPIINKNSYLDTVYVKFNTLDLPTKNGAVDYTAFDLKIAGEVPEDHVHITGLKCGKYYFFAAGYDTTINQRVFGGISKDITQSSGEIDLDIPVTEGD